MSQPALKPTRHHNQVVRGLFFVAGLMAFCLGLVGVVTPVLPTTPLILLAGFCWARSSRRFYEWLIKHQTFGKMLKEWQERRAIPRSAKYMAWGMMTLSLVGLWHRLPADKLWVALLLSVACLMGAIWMARLPDA